MTNPDLETHPVHLGLGGATVIEPTFTGEMDWYGAYEARHAADGDEGRLVSVHRFDKPWTTWEMHPRGGELVLCLSGTITLHQERLDGSVAATILHAGQYVINDAGVWHTADTDGPASALFVTAGAGTQVRDRAP